jgi:hypothetical protein
MRKALLSLIFYTYKMVHVQMGRGKDERIVAQAISYTFRNFKNSNVLL